MAKSTELEGHSSVPPSAETASSTTAGWLKLVPLVTGILAAIAGYLTVQGTNLSNLAIYHSNQAVLHQAQASDTWAEYQADSTKARVVETALIIGVNEQKAREQLGAQDKDLRDRQPALKTQAQQLEKSRDEELKQSEGKLKDKDLISYGGVAVQLAIVLVSISATTRRKEAFSIGLVVGVIGLGLAAYGLILSL